MSNVNYSLKHKGVRLIDAQTAWIKGKNGKLRLNPNYKFVGKMEMTMPNVIVTASDKRKPTYKGNTYDLNVTAKKEIVDHFYDNKGKRNKKTVAYFGIPKAVAIPNNVTINNNKSGSLSPIPKTKNGKK